TVLARALRVYDPLAIAALGVMVMTGAVNLTAYKDALRGQFFARLGWLLVYKLILAFWVVMIGTYITFGLGHRIVRSEMSGEPACLASITRRLASACVLVLLLVAATTWLGLELGHPHHFGAPEATSAPDQQTSRDQSAVSRAPVPPRPIAGTEEPVRQNGITK